MPHVFFALRRLDKCRPGVQGSATLAPPECEVTYAAAYNEEIETAHVTGVLPDEDEDGR